MDARSLPVFALSLLLAGCLGSGDDSAPGSPDGGDRADSDPWPAIQDLMAGVPCDAEVNSGQSANLVQLANVTYDLEQTGIHGELDIRGNLALHARSWARLTARCAGCGGEGQDRAGGDGGGRGPAA